MSATALGEFLRARREQLRPEDVGLAWSGRRRVRGLRREELAMLAGVSTDYYLRLEQGRDIRPSAPVVNALARALQLDEDATAHLHALASRPPERPRGSAHERAAAHVERLIATWSRTPAFIHDRYMDVLATNALITAITPVLHPGANLIRATFLEPEIRKRLHDWDSVAAINVARLRSMAGADLGSPRLVKLVEETPRVHRVRQRRRCGVARGQSRDAAGRAARAARAHRHQEGLRPGRLRCVHRACRRQARAVVSDAGGSV